MAPEAWAMQRLLYVSDEQSGDVGVYSYPGGKPEGLLKGFSAPQGICTNRAGDVFILNGGGTTVDVFAHGGTKPIRVLQLPGNPSFSCSVDPQTGDLALGVLESRGGSVIAVFKRAKGDAIVYRPAGQSLLPGCAYDDLGNLFCDAFSSGGQRFALYELAKGSSTVQQIAVATSALPGAMQWDGEYLAFTDGSTGTIDRVQVAGSGGTIVGSTTLNVTGIVYQFWIPDVPEGGGAEATRIIAPTFTYTQQSVDYFDYPAGGDATKQIRSGGLAQPDGVAVSVRR